MFKSVLNGHDLKTVVILLKKAFPNTKRTILSYFFKSLNSNVDYADAPHAEYPNIVNENELDTCKRIAGQEIEGDY